MGIPHYESKWLQLLDREDEVELVEHNYPQFMKLYRPVFRENFQDFFDITEDGRFIIDQTDSAARQHLLSYVNDNVYQNLDKRGLSVKIYKSTTVSEGSEGKQGDKMTKKDPLQFD